MGKVSFHDEEMRSLLDARALLRELALGFYFSDGVCVKSSHRRVPKSVREAARRIVRHYPWSREIERRWSK